jgi:hypothetical protein
VSRVHAEAGELLTVSPRWQPVDWPEARAVLAKHLAKPQEQPPRGRWQRFYKTGTRIAVVRRNVIHGGWEIRIGHAEV